jgi:hypothetical protein
MRSRRDYIVTKDEIYAEAESRLATALKLKWNGYKCTPSCLLQILLLAAARVVSIWAACRSLADAPSGQAVFDALRASLPEPKELERRLNGALHGHLPKALFRKAREIAIDITLLPYYGEPQHDVSEIYRSQRKAGTSRFHAYATACIVHKGHRYTLALTRVLAGESMKTVVERLLRELRRSGVKIKFLLLDRGFFSAAVIRYLRPKVGFVIPVALRGRKPKAKQRAKSKLLLLRAMLKNRNGYYKHVLSGKDGDRVVKASVTICVAGNPRPRRKTRRKRAKKLLYAVSHVRLTPSQIHQKYRRRFGIETSYRQMNEARIRTCARDVKLRLLFVAIALLLRNVWAWLHFRLAKHKHAPEPTLFLELLRFRNLLLWIAQIVDKTLDADGIQGIESATYQRLTAPP